MIAENLSFLAGGSIIGRCGGRNNFLHEINVGIHSNLVQALGAMGGSGFLLLASPLATCPIFMMSSQKKPF
jgi:hypothetical protein